MKGKKGNRNISEEGIMGSFFKIFDTKIKLIKKVDD